MEKIKDINRLNDVFFKSLLGSKERKNLTLNFLNSILNKDEDSYFVDINFLDKERLPDMNMMMIGGTMTATNMMMTMIGTMTVGMINQ